MTRQRRPRQEVSQSALLPRASSQPPNANPTRSSSDVIRPSSANALARKECPRCGERYPADFRVCPRDAIELQETNEREVDPLLGMVLADNYAIRRMIGEGAMGRVYEARHTRLSSRRFAIKVLHAELTRQSEVVERFLREAESTSVLQHPNIVGVLDVNQLPDGRPYLVAELLEGEQLGDYLDRKGKLSVDDAVKICRGICHALAAAHAKNIIHRDVKPDNVFLVGRGAQRVVKVLDFGISRVNDAATANLTKTGMVMGTPAYMPPEQARGARVDFRADIYAVGALLYEAVTGQRAFDDDDPVTTLASVLTRDPPRPTVLNSALPPGLELVIQRAMAKKPEERYRTMRELDRALAEFDRSAQGDDDIAALPESAPPPPPRRRRSSQLRQLWTGETPAPESARSSLLALSSAAGLCAFVGLIDVSTSLVRMSRGGAPLTAAEIVLAALGAAGMLVAPTIAWALYLRLRVWPNTPRVLDVLARSKRVLSASLIVYAVGSLFVRLIAAALRSDPRVSIWPGWTIGISAAAACAGLSAAWFAWRTPRAADTLPPSAIMSAER
jgi:serine/threonine protein kinase